ncbi:hypothetical protein [Pradoshia sp. D12]|uniref:hypothetical protein n=1 Tax=Pradoshia sp. D12 TaxID=2651284 RepID=UPI00178C649B|nr:hypothetical protein [Pradoshia sp. D12]
MKEFDCFEKKTTLILFVLSFIYLSLAQALSWNKYFVVWEGKVYEIKEDEAIDPREIGKYIGKVESGQMTIPGIIKETALTFTL